MAIEPGLLPPDWTDTAWEVWPGVVLRWSGTPREAIVSYELTATGRAVLPYELRGPEGGRGLVWGLELTFGEA